MQKNIHKISITAFLIVIVLCASSIWAKSEEWQLTRNEHWASTVEDRVYDVAISGTKAYLAHGVRGLVVWDISTPAHPKEISSHLLNGSAHMLYLDGSQLYVGTSKGNGFHPDQQGSDEIRLYDIAEDVPKELGRVENRFRQSALAGVNGIAIVAKGNDTMFPSDRGLMAVDFNDPSGPAIYHLRNRLFRGVMDIAISGAIGYIATTTGVHVLDLSDPLTPEVTATYTQGSNYFYTVATLGNRLFTNTPPDFGSKVQEIDFSDPLNPESLWDYDVKGQLGSLRTIAVSDHLLAAAGLGNSIHLMDVGDPDLYPDVFGDIHTSLSVTGMAFGQDTLWVADPIRQFSWLDISYPQEPLVLGTHSIQSEPRKTQQIGSFVYEINDVRDFTIYEIQDSGAVAVKGSLTRETGYYTDFHIQESIAFLTDSRGQFETIDLENPEQPRQISQLDLDIGYAHALELSGNLAFVAGGLAGLIILDVSQPDIPSYISNQPVSGNYGSVDIKVHDEIAYLIKGYEGLEWIDVHDPDAPKSLGHLTLETQPGNFGGQIDIWGDTAVVAGSGAHLLDLSVPTRPRRIRSLPSNGAVQAVSIFGNQVALGIHEAEGDRIELHDIAKQEIIAGVFLGPASERNGFGRMILDDQGLIVSHGNYGIIQFKLEQLMSIQHISISVDGIPEIHLPDLGEGSIEVLASNDLKTWRQIGIHDTSTGGVFTDSGSQGEALRFYRLGRKID